MQVAVERGRVARHPVVRPHRRLGGPALQNKEEEKSEGRGLRISTRVESRGRVKVGLSSTTKGRGPCSRGLERSRERERVARARDSDAIL